MENTVYKTYELEDELDLYININGMPKFSKRKGSMLSTHGNQLNEEEIDDQIKRDFIDDIDEPENVTEEVRLNRIKRYQKIVKRLKKEYNYQCQLCRDNFLMDNGNYYCEAHHIKMLSKDGSQSPENVLILCAKHHRMFHYASNTCIIGKLIKGKRNIKIGKEEFMVQYNLLNL